MKIKLPKIGSYVLRNYLLETELGWIPIDTGYASDCNKILQRFSKLAALENFMK
ncbi:hypothetical protein M2454_000203 [Aequitasia blattaphilus]|uniref:Uncharacterized protein n=1 Tax=Aequitasia blattaphilus TaxID=2949332 RepID=A0ABT1E564_9FIRM|nr:hypothetical protein [Aequitasia blattaphilus]MCP1100984.1 hypothetical protein [Aequitasia blattaphilus]MCR8613624.1 hypothetical protein [Aequitasia blattaphilus]